MASVSHIASDLSISSSSAPSSVTTMSDENVTGGSDTEVCRPFPLLLLPVEIQLKIYRFAWMTGPVEELPSTYFTHELEDFIERTTDKNALIQRELRKKVNEELSTVQTMGSVCRHMRNAVYEEYFSRTQAVLQPNEILFRQLPGNIALVRGFNHDLWLAVSKSTLVSEHIRHVCLVITDEQIVFDKGWAYFRRLIWLISLRNLTTLEIVFEYPERHRKMHWWSEGLPGVEWARHMIQSLPCLKKLAFSLKWSHSYPQGEAIVWEEFPWFLELRRVFLENATVSEVCFHFHPPNLCTPIRRSWEWLLTWISTNE